MQRVDDQRSGTGPTVAPRPPVRRRPGLRAAASLDVGRSATRDLRDELLGPTTPASARVPRNAELPDPEAPAPTGQRRIDVGDAALVDSHAVPWNHDHVSFADHRPDRAAIIVLVAGEATFAQGGCSWELGPGDVVVWDGDPEARVVVRSVLHAYTLIVPRDRLPELAYRQRARVASDAPGTRLLRDYLGRLLPDLADMRTDQAFAAIDAAVAMVRMAMCSAPTAPDREPIRVALMPQATRWIEARLHEPDLHPPRIADALAISVRTLQAMFALEGTTVSAFVRERRLQASRRELQSNPGATVTEVARAFGFRSTAHFARSFREAFGESPSDARARPS